MRNFVYSSVILMIVLVATGLITPVSPVEASSNAEYNLKIRLDEVFIYDDTAGLWDGYFRFDLYINGIYVQTWGTWQIRGDTDHPLNGDEKTYFDFASTRSESEIPHPTSGGLEHNSVQTSEILDIDVRIREVGAAGSYSNDAGRSLFQLNSTEMGVSTYDRGWVTSGTPINKIYFYVTISDTRSPEIDNLIISPSSSFRGEDSLVRFFAYIRDFSDLWVYLEYELDFSGTVLTKNLTKFFEFPDYDVYNITLGSFPYGTYIGYTLWADDGVSKSGIGGAFGIGQPLSEARSFDIQADYSGTIAYDQSDYYNFTLSQPSFVNITVDCSSDAHLLLSLYNETGSIQEVNYEDNPNYPYQQILTVPLLPAGNYYAKLMQINYNEAKSPYQIHLMKNTGSIAPIISFVDYPSSANSSDDSILVEFNVTDDVFVSDVFFSYSFDDGATWTEMKDIDGFYKSNYEFNTSTGITPQYREIFLTEDEFIYVNCTWNYNTGEDMMDFSIHQLGVTEFNASLYTQMYTSALGSGDPSPELATMKVRDTGFHLFKTNNFAGIEYQTGNITILSSHLSVEIPGNPFPQDSIPVQFKINAIDNQGHVSEQTFSIPVTDDIAPSVNILTPVDGELYNTGTLSISFTTTDDNTTWYLNGGLQGTITNNSLISIPEGVDHNITVVATDMGGLTNKDTIFVSIDTTLPIVQINTPVEGSFSHVNDILIEYQVTDLHIVAGEIVNHVEVFLNDENRGYLASGYTFVSLSQGFYNLTIVATDTYGNVGKDTITFTIDTDTPIVNFLSPNPVIYSNSLIDIQYSYTETGTIAFFLNEASYPFITNDSLIQFPDGSYNLTITVTDQAGNVGVHSVLFTVDTTPPNVEIISPYQDYYNVTDLSIMWTLEPGTIVNDIIIDGIGTILINNSVRSFSEGNHNITLVVEDSAGNVKVVSRIFTIDATNPDLEIISPISQIYEYADILLVYSSDEPLSIIAIYLDGELVSVSNNSKTSSLSEGEHTLIIRVTDLAGNTAQASVTFTIELPVTTTTTTTTSVITSTTTSSTTSEAGTGFSFILFFPALFILLVILRRSKIE